MITSSHAFHTARQYERASDKTFYIASINGVPEVVTAKGIHKSSGQEAYEFMRVRARNTNEACRKFFNGDGEWIEGEDQ